MAVVVVVAVAVVVVGVSDKTAVVNCCSDC